MRQSEDLSVDTEDNPLLADVIERNINKLIRLRVQTAQKRT